MPRAKKIQDLVQELEYELAKNKAVQAVFPDAKVHFSSGFASKIVNQTYTKFEFEKRWSGLYILPYCEVNFTFNNKTEIIKVHSQPRRNRLAYISRKRNIDGKRIMKFSRLSINLKNNSFKDDMINACRSQIATFIKTNPTYHMDDKYLDARLKNLLVFM